MFDWAVHACLSLRVLAIKSLSEENTFFEELFRDGFYRYIKILENLAQKIASREIKVPP